VSPSKRQSPADVSGTNEEWETASEGSDGGHHARRQAAHRDDGMKYSAAKCSAESMKPCAEPDSTNSGTLHSPCTSGVPSVAARTDFEHGWKDAATYPSHSATLCGLSVTGSTNTDSADVAVNHPSSPGVPPSSSLFSVSFSDPGTKQPSLHDAIARFEHTPCLKKTNHRDFYYNLSCFWTYLQLANLCENSVHTHKNV